MATPDVDPGHLDKLRAHSLVLAREAPELGEAVPEGVRDPRPVRRLLLERGELAPFGK